MLRPKSASTPLVITIGVECDVGKERTENQDRVTRAATPFGEVFVVADGVGGYKGGSDAAQATVDGVVRYLNASHDLPLAEALQQAVRNISHDLQQRADSDPALRGMGSTVVLCVVSGAGATYAHAGDSRAYIVRDRQLKQLTRDHSMMERLVSQGVLTPEQAREHPDSSVLTRAIGQSPDVSLDIGEITVQSGDALLLCSDGLWAYAKHAEMEAVAISENLSASAVASALLNLALKGGGGDNISIQFLRFQAAESAQKNNTLLGMPQNALYPVIGLASVLGIVASGLFIWNQGHRMGDSAPTVAEATKPVNPPHVPEVPATTPAKMSKKTAGAAKNDASAAKKPDISPPSAEQPAKTPVTIIQGKGKAAEWAGDLRQLPDVKASVLEGTNACLKLGRSKAILFHSPQQAKRAREIGDKLHLPADGVMEMSQEDLEKCGGGDLIAMPVNPSLLKQAQETVGAVADPYKRKVEPYRKKAEEEIKKRTTDPPPF